MNIIISGDTGIHVLIVVPTGPPVRQEEFTDGVILEQIKNQDAAEKEEECVPVVGRLSWLQLKPNRST